jgi:hypothetical protein|nr:MAG TPA: hypothetical protein [Caudoviricetes sp.]
MTDKEIIINGIDVSECRYLFDDTSYKRSKTSCSITLKDCKYLGDKCYFKQLKRKEQECEELKFNEKNFRIDAARAKMKASKYKQALDEIESLCKNEACSPCKELEENNHCDECHNKIILDIINKAKEK